MNLQAPELSDLTAAVTGKLSEGVQLSNIVSSFQIPKLNNVSQLLGSLLPQKLSNFNSEGILQMLKPSALQDALKTGLENLQGEIEGEIKGVLDEVINTAGQVNDAINSATQTLKDIGNFDLLSNQSGFFEQSFNAASSVANLNIDVGTVSKFGQTITKAASTVKDLTPKQVRDLADPTYYNEVVKSTLDKANTMLTNDVMDTVKDYVKIPSSIGAVGSLFSTANSLLQNSTPSGVFSMEASISTYYAKGDGADIDAFNYKSATGRKLLPGKSCAVDNVRILFNSKVEVPGLGAFTAVDKLKGGGSDIQLFFDTAADALKAQASLTSKILVKITPPSPPVIADTVYAGVRGTLSDLI